MGLDPDRTLRRIFDGQTGLLLDLVGCLGRKAIHTRTAPEGHLGARAPGRNDRNFRALGIGIQNARLREVLDVHLVGVVFQLGLLRCHQVIAVFGIAAGDLGLDSLAVLEEELIIIHDDLRGRPVLGKPKTRIRRYEHQISRIHKGLRLNLERELIPRFQKKRLDAKRIEFEWLRLDLLVLLIVHRFLGKTVFSKAFQNVVQMSFAFKVCHQILPRRVGSKRRSFLRRFDGLHVVALTLDGPCRNDNQQHDRRQLCPDWKL